MLRLAFILPILLFGICVNGAPIEEDQASRTAFLNCVADQIPQDMGSAAHDFVRRLDLKNGPFIDANAITGAKLKALCSNANDEFKALKSAYEQCSSTDPQLSRAMIGSILAEQYLCQDIEQTMEMQKCISSIYKDLQEPRVFTNIPKYHLVGPVGTICQFATGFYHSYGAKLKECGFDKDVLISYENYVSIGVTAKRLLPNTNYTKCAFRPSFP